MDGSGPRGREVRREEPVEEVRNLVDGTCRGRHPREQRTCAPTSSKGRMNPRRGVLGREAEDGTCGGEP